MTVPAVEEYVTALDWVVIAAAVIALGALLLFLRHPPDSPESPG